MPRQQWECPVCKRHIVLHVKPSCPPVCTNPEKHSRQPTPMEKVEFEHGR